MMLELIWSPEKSNHYLANQSKTARFLLSRTTETLNVRSLRVSDSVTGRESSVEMISNDELIAQARDARRFAHAPYSNFNVGAALVTSDGRVFTGCNVENSTYGLSMCA